MGASFSGHERNHLFLNDGGDHFIEPSGISGLDDPSDSRCFAIFDYNLDGWQDIVMTNANAPRLRLFKNRIGELAAGTNHNFVAIRYVGGNRTATVSEKWSPVDGFGAIGTFDLGGMRLKREYRGGEGMAAQNSATSIVGIGAYKSVEKLTVRWPRSGVQELSDIPAGSLITVFENQADSPTGSPFVLTPYLSRAESELHAEESVVKNNSLAGMDSNLIELSGVSLEDESLVVYTTMATWCASCRKKLSAMKQLRDRFDVEEVAMFGIPVDIADTTEMLAEYEEKLSTPYTLLTELPAGEREGVKQLVIKHLGIDALPATIIADRQGKILKVVNGAPTISDLRKLMVK